jgi:hypothetical protein
VYGIRNEYDAAFFRELYKTVNAPGFKPEGFVYTGTKPLGWKKADTSVDLTEILKKVKFMPPSPAMKAELMSFQKEVSERIEDRMVLALAGHRFY